LRPLTGRATIERQVRQVQVSASGTVHTDSHEFLGVVGQLFHAGSFLAVPRGRFRAEDRSTSSHRDVKWFFFEGIEMCPEHKGRPANGRDDQGGRCGGAVR
jgi:hypothetical protein